MTLQRRVDALLAIQRHSEIEAELSTGNLLVPLAAHGTAPGHGGVNATFSGFLANGWQVFHKPFSGVNANAAHHYGHTADDPPMHEVAAWRLARALGPPWDSLVPPSALRNLPPGGPGSFTLGVTGVPHSSEPFGAAPADVAAAAFWDALVAQQDRHGGNYRWDSAANRLSLIDHGFCFAESGHFLNASVFVEWRHAQGGSALTGQEIALLRALAASPKLYGLADILVPNRAAALRTRAEAMMNAVQLLPAGAF